MTELEQCSLIKARKREPDRKPPPPPSSSRMIKREGKKWREDDAISRHASRILQLKVTFVREEDKWISRRIRIHVGTDGRMGGVSCSIEASTVVPGCKIFAFSSLTKICALPHLLIRPGHF